MHALDDSSDDEGERHLEDLECLLRPDALDLWRDSLRHGDHVCKNQKMKRKQGIGDKLVEEGVA